MRGRRSILKGLCCFLLFAGGSLAGGTKPKIEALTERLKADKLEGFFEHNEKHEIPRRGASYFFSTDFRLEIERENKDIYWKLGNDDSKRVVVEIRDYGKKGTTLKILDFGANGLIGGKENQHVILGGRKIECSVKVRDAVVISESGAEKYVCSYGNLKPRVRKQVDRIYEQAFEMGVEEVDRFVPKLRQEYKERNDSEIGEKIKEIRGK